MPPDTPTERPLIAISQCILGDRVRYDGQVNTYTDLLSFIHSHFQTIAVCPEVEIGLSVPRPPVQLSSDGKQIKITGRDDPSIDITEPMEQFCQQRSLQLNSIQGYIFKSKSPSCGVTDVPLFNPQGEVISMGAGLFAQTMLQRYPNLPITDEQTLDTQQQRELFLQSVQNYREYSISHD